MCDKVSLKFLYDDSSCFAVQLIHFEIPRVVVYCAEIILVMKCEDVSGNFLPAGLDVGS